MKKQNKNKQTKEKREKISSHSWHISSTQVSIFFKISREEEKWEGRSYEGFSLSSAVRSTSFPPKSSSNMKWYVTWTVSKTYECFSTLIWSDLRAWLGLGREVTITVVMNRVIDNNEAVAWTMREVEALGWIMNQVQGRAWLTRKIGKMSLSYVWSRRKSLNTERSGRESLNDGWSTYVLDWRKSSNVGWSRRKLLNN